MQVSFFKYFITGVVLLSLAACGGGGGGDAGADNRSVQQIRAELFSSGLWRAESFSSNSNLQKFSEFLVVNDGVSVTVVSCDLSESFIETLSWQSDTNITSTTSALRISLDANVDNKFNLFQDGFNAELFAGSSSAQLTATGLSQSALTACGGADNQSLLNFLTLIDGSLYYVGADFMQLSSLVNYSDTSSAQVAFAPLNASTLASIAAGSLTLFSTAASINVSSCDDAVQGTIANLDLNGANFNLSFSAEATNDQPLNCAVSAGSGESAPASVDVSENIDAVNCVADETATGELSGIWQFEASSVSQALTIDELLTRSDVAELAESNGLSGLVTQELLLFEEDVVGASTVQAALCVSNGSLSNAQKSISLDRTGNSLQDSNGSSGSAERPLGVFFEELTVVSDDELQLDFSGIPLVGSVAATLGLDTLSFKRQNPGERFFCMQQTRVGVSAAETSTLLSVGCVDFTGNDDSTNNRTLLLNASINNQPVLVYVNFRKQITSGQYWLDAGDDTRGIQGIQVKLGDTEGLLDATQAYIELGTLNPPVFEGRFIIEVVQDGETIELQGNFSQGI